MAQKIENRLFCAKATLLFWWDSCGWRWNVWSETSRIEFRQELYMVGITHTCTHACPHAHHATPRHATPRHATPHHATPHHTTPHHATPRHATPRHTTPHHASSACTHAFVGVQQHRGAALWASSVPAAVSAYKGDTASAPPPPPPPPPCRCLWM